MVNLLVHLAPGYGFYTSWVKRIYPFGGAQEMITIRIFQNCEIRLERLGHEIGNRYPHNADKGANVGSLLRCRLEKFLDIPSE